MILPQEIHLEKILPASQQEKSFEFIYHRKFGFTISHLRAE